MYPLDNLEYTIDSIYKQLLQKLTEENKIHHVSQQLLAMAENEERVLFVYSFLRGYGLIPLLLKVMKCDYVSTHYRNLGNQCYQRGSLYEALQYYNMALCFAPVLSENFSLAMSNRTAVLAALKKYKDCLTDINLIFTIHYPEKIRDKLLKRKNQCKEGLNLNPEPDEEDVDDPDFLEVLKLNGPRHKSYISASAKLRVEYDPDIGRHVIANEDIAVGEVIVQEDPYIGMVMKNQLALCCGYCFKRKLTLRPCPYCCFTMYCDKECGDKAWEEYHMYECPMIATLLRMNFSKLEMLALRITIKARTDHQDWECVFASVLDAETLLYTNHWGHVIVDGNQGDRWVYDSQYYSSIQTLCTNDEKRDISDIFQKSVSAAVLLHCLAVVNFNKLDGGDIYMKQKIKRFAAGTLLLHMMTGPTNMHSITANVENESGNFVDEYNLGIAPYAFLSLINHSCSPNVVRYSKLGTTRMSLIALRPIKKGTMIVDNYGAHHAIHTRDERQAILKSQYKFLCECEACINDWPLYQNLPVVQNLPEAIAKKKNELLSSEVIEALQKGDHDRATKLYKPLCELATDLDPYMPCQELAECQEAMKQCLAIMMGVLPHGFTKVVDWEVPPPQMPGAPVMSRFYTGYGAQDLN
ncbi:SET and MYND domain-containing protein 4 isoform X2 [Trichoplusia ni]|uniref:Protein-lysine N-methyltransferase SMYD4 n=1 Tax=Trichoplusia ni TaxID=7111 RepID=A0A7E5V8B4_TRINI|nr:SET and MYND domain-containing protein 4 isoform X2 [Trichoplusia ni]